jgi:hypothetical protein
MVDALAAGAASTALITDALERARPAVDHAASSMGTIAGHAKSAAGYIIGATERLAKWAALSLGAGLLGGGVGLWGLDRLGESVAATRRTSMGLGISAGELQAFNVNYGARLGLGTGFLETVQGAKFDQGQAGVFAQMGIPWTQVQNENTTDLTMDVIRRANALWRNSSGPGAHTIQAMQANGLAGLGMSPEMWQTIGRQDPRDLERWGQQYRRDIGTLNPSDPTQKAWTEFVTQLTRAREQIDIVFVKALQPLIDSGALPKLSGAVEHLVEKFFANQNVIRWVDDFARLISQTGDYLGSDKFQSDMKTFVDDIAYAAGKMVWVIQALHLLPSPEPGTPIIPGTVFNASDTSLPPPVKDIRDIGLGKWDFTGVEDLNQLPHGLLKAVGWEESHLNIRAPDSPKGAQGMFQQMPEYQKQYGVTEPWNVQQESNAAGRGIHDYLIKYRGDLAEALAAYNWGPANLDKDIAAHGSDWRRFAPKETQNYIQDVIGNTPGSPTQVNVNVNVTNQTGANVAITANAVR